MSQQALNARKAAGAIRRRTRWVLAAGLLGVVLAAVYVLLQPARLSSSTLILLAVSGGGEQENTVAVDTAVEIAGSGSILAAAGETVSPRLSAKEVDGRVKITAVTEQLIRVEARDPDGRVAQGLAAGLADAYVTYERAASNSVNAQALKDLNARKDDLEGTVDRLQGEIEKARERKAQVSDTSADGRREAQLVAQLQAEQSNTALRLDTVKAQIASADLPQSGASGPKATIVQAATPPIERSPVGALLLWSPIGFVAGALLGALGLVLGASRDRRLRLRDEIADAVGSTVLASAASHGPVSVPAWTLLLQNYRPSPMDEMALRQLLRALIHDGATKGVGARLEHPRSLTVISLDGDRRALAIGPQLASYTASQGIRTRLLLAGNHTPVPAALHTACYAERRDDVRANLITGEVRAGEAVDLSIIVTVLDSEDSHLAGSTWLRTDAVVLAVAAGAALADDLARVAVALDAVGKRLDGIVVADPERTDRTSGRQTVVQRHNQVALPMRLMGVPAGRPSSRGVTSR